MSPVLKNILAVITGVILGSVVNMGILMVGQVIIPPPGDTSTMEALEATMHLFAPKDFIFPFLAHAVGTLIGAMVAVKMAANHPKRLALIVGLLFFIAGSINVYSLPAPLWYNIIDLVLAYFPMAFLASKWMVKNSND